MNTFLLVSCVNNNASSKRENMKTIVVSPVLTQSAFSIPDCPKYMSKELINKMTNIYVLQKIETEYDEFLEKRCQILMLLNIIDEVFEVRDQLISRISCLKKQARKQYMRENYRHLTTNWTIWTNKKIELF